MTFPPRWRGGMPGAALESPSWRTRALVLVALTIVGAAVYGRVAGLVYKEYSDWALFFGDYPWNRGRDFWSVLQSFGEVEFGRWYRPTSFFLVPYLLGIDYFRPATQAVANIAFFVLATWVMTLLLRRASLLPMLLGGLVMLTAPALYLVPYGAQIDSLYVLFSLLFILAGLRLHRGEDSGWRRVALHIGMVASFLAAITSKEIALLAPLLLFGALLLADDRLSRANARAAFIRTAPFLVAAILGAVAFQAITDAPPDDQYTNAFRPEKSEKTIDMLAWATGFRWPASQFSFYIPDWGRFADTIALALLVITLIGAALAWRRLRLWRIAVFCLTTLVVAVAIALVGSLPHHAFPLVVLYGFAAAAVTQSLWEELRFRPRARSLRFVGLACLSALCLAVALNGRARFQDALERGPNTAVIGASTELFYGATLQPVREATNPFLVFEDCLGGLHNPLKYFARATSGTEVTVPAFDPSALAPQIREALSAGRPVFIAECTGHVDPWYRLVRWKGLGVPVGRPARQQRPEG